MGVYRKAIERQRSGERRSVTASIADKDFLVQRAPSLIIPCCGMGMFLRGLYPRSVHSLRVAVDGNHRVTGARKVRHLLNQVETAPIANKAPVEGDPECAISKAGTPPNLYGLEFGDRGSER